MIQNNTYLYSAVAALAGSLLLGGGTRSGLLSDVILQLACLPVLIYSLGQTFVPRRVNVATDIIFAPSRPSPAANISIGLPPPHTDNRRLALCLLLIALSCLLPMLQITPLPQSWWAALPGRGLVRAAFDYIALPLPDWMALSIAPHATWQSLLALIPPLAVFFTVIQLSSAHRRRLSVIVLAIAVTSVFVGLAQLAQGPGSRLRFYAITNETEAVGFFANRNHFAALLYCAILVAAAWALELTRSFEMLRPERRFEAANILPLLAVFTVLVALLAAQSTTRSRAGLGLTIIAVIGGFALAFPERRRTKSSGMSGRILVGTIGIAVFMAIQLSLYRILERFATDPMADPRVVMARNTIAAAKSFMPFGSGVGTFVPVYAAFEKPQDVLSGVYVNRAHNDFLEVWLETGVFGPAIFVLFLLWFLARSFRVWRPTNPGRSIDHSLTRAATLIILLLIAHSTTDYPLRTGGLMAVFAFAAAMLIAPPPDADAAEQAVDAAALAKRGRSERRSMPRDQRRGELVEVTTANPVPDRKVSHTNAMLAAGDAINNADELGVITRSPRSEPNLAAPPPIPALQVTPPPWPGKMTQTDHIKSTDWPQAWQPKAKPPAPGMQGPQQPEPKLSDKKGD